MFQNLNKIDNLGEAKRYIKLSDTVEIDDANCICQRKSECFQCEKCFNYFQGRLAKICPSHSGETFFMDARVCPFCTAPISFMRLCDENEMSLEKENYLTFNPNCISTPMKYRGKVKRDDYEAGFEMICNCYRKEQVFNCQRCYQFFKGRLAEICPSHLQVCFSKDVNTCPYCNAPQTLLEISDVETMTLAEGKEMPDDDSLNDL